MVIHPSSRLTDSEPVYPASRLVRHPALLRVLLANPSREFTIRELALESGTPYATAWRLATLLRDWGVLRERRVGASRAVSVNRGSPLVPELRRLLEVRLDPHRAAARWFARLLPERGDVEAVVLFGSAARDAARPSSDVDVAVIVGRRTDAVVEAVDRAAARVEDRTGLKVVPIPVTREELRANTRLARDIREGEVLRGRS